MSVATMILGQSGQGKTTSLRNLDPANVILIQCLRKSLPFPSKDWQYRSAERPGGNIIWTDNPAKILDICNRLSASKTRKIIVIDDFQYMMSNEFMRRTDEKGYGKFNDIGRAAWAVMKTISELDDDMRVYLLAHTQESESGRESMKTIGKMLDDKITPEGMFTIVLKAIRANDQNWFTTVSSGSDPVKSPMGLFDEARVPNDLDVVDKRICEYHNLKIKADTPNNVRSITP